MNVIDIPRSTDNVQFNIDLLNKLGIKFIVQHGTYTTTIITEESKARYMMNIYSKRVFKCANMIKSDVLKSENAQKIIAAKYLKTNFAISQDVKSYSAKKVLNIDINQAYATCLLRNDLITEKTFNIIKNLPKTERLPCVGMLATSHTKFHYENGNCFQVDGFRAVTAPVFYYLIDEINYIMQNIQFLLGSSFVFYWVDGVFFDFNTDKQCVKDVENFLTENGYEYKYEDVQYFSIETDDKKMMLKMIKNGTSKQYVVGMDDVGNDIKNYLSNGIEKQKTQPNYSN